MSTLREKNPAVELMTQRLSLLITDECRHKCLSFVPRSSDVIISTAPKCGTTWMQQIVHQLRSGGDMTFTDIDEVVPWMDVAYDVGQDLDDEQKYQPRCFKNHPAYGDCPKGAKYIVVYREPCAAFYSSFKFFQGKLFPLEEITVDEFVKYLHLSPEEPKTRLERVNYFEHLLSSWARRNDPNVLFLLYEDMLEDLETAVRAVASFMEIGDEKNITNAVKMSAFDFMKQHSNQFTCNHVARYRNEAIGLPEGVVVQRVVTGSATKGWELMDDCTKKAVQKMWNETITKEIGFHDYSELRAAFKNEKRFVS